MSRTVETWVGKSHDSKIPDRVRLRIWMREDGRCYITGKRIMPGDKFEYEHVIALCNGGTHSEDNIRLVLAGATHREKTNKDLKVRVRGDKAAKRHIGIKKPSKFQTSRQGPYKQKLDGTLVWRSTGEPVGKER